LSSRVGVRDNRASYPKFPHDESRVSVDRLLKNPELFHTDPWISSPNLTPFTFIFRKPIFALKGGTAINLFVQEMPRLSVDLDLVYIAL
jgi:hypothetical protein